MNQRLSLVRSRRLVVVLAVLTPLSFSEGAFGQNESITREQTIDIGAGPIAAIAIGYSRLFQESGFQGGVNLWYSFEERMKTFDHNVWDAFGIDMFTRRLVSPEVQIDLGVSLLAFAPEDDTGETGTFAGLFGAAYFGGRFLFAGIELRSGVSSVYDHTEFGLLASPRLKLQLSF